MNRNTGYIDEWNRLREADAAQVGRNPKGQDPEGLGAKHEHAAGAEGGDAPKGSQ